MSPCEACGMAARFIVAGRCHSCGHVQGQETDQRIWLP